MNEEEKEALFDTLKRIEDEVSTPNEAKIRCPKCGREEIVILPNLGETQFMCMDLSCKKMGVPFKVVYKWVK